MNSSKLFERLSDPELRTFAKEMRLIGYLVSLLPFKGGKDGKGGEEGICVREEGAHFDLAYREGEYYFIEDYCPHVHVTDLYAGIQRAREYLSRVEARSG